VVEDRHGPLGSNSRTRVTRVVSGPSAASRAQAPPKATSTQSLGGVDRNIADAWLCPNRGPDRSFRSADLTAWR
jgi:hypothetical protein